MALSPTRDSAAMPPSDCEETRHAPRVEGTNARSGSLLRLLAHGRAMLCADVAVPVDLFRVLVGFLALGYCVRQLGEIDLYWGPHSLVPHAVSRSVFAFTWQPLFPLDASTGWVTALFGTGCVLSVAIVLGIFPRLCALGLYALVVCAYRYDFLVLFVDDVVVHLLLFWVVLLPVGSTLSVSELLRRRKGSWAKWRRARVSGTTVRLFLANLAFLYLVAGLSKWGSPLWRSGDALYAVFQLPMSRLSELVNHSHVPLLRYLDYATLGPRLSFSPIELSTPEHA